MGDDAPTVTMDTPNGGTPKKDETVLRVQRVVLAAPDGQVAQLGWFGGDLCLVVNAGPTTEAGTTWRSINKTLGALRLRMPLKGASGSFLGFGRATHGAGSLTWNDTRILYGTVNSDGTPNLPTSSKGWTSVRTALGEYTVTFQTAFAQIPTVLLSSGGTANHANLWWYTPTTGSFGIHASNNLDTADVDVAWSFLVIGEG